MIEWSPVSYHNLTELLRLQSERLGPQPALRYRRYGLFHDVSWERYRQEALACGAGLADAGIRPGDRVGILAENRLEWLIADMGILAAAAVNVPPHAPLTARQVLFQLQDAGVRWIFVSTRDQLAKIEQVRRELPQLKGVVVFDPGAPGQQAISWNAFLAQGRRALANLQAEMERRENALQLEDLATVMYTSGTTGNPKGVMLTHGNLLSNALASWQVGHHPADSVVLNWLPLSHIYARLVDHYQSIVGGMLVCIATSAETLVQDI